MVNHKSALQKLWTDTCTVYTQTKTKDPTTKRTVPTESALLTDQPCKLSIESLSTVSETDHAPVVTQAVKLFIDSDLTIPAGSKVVVTRGSRQFIYKASGEPGIFTDHQEISLELFERWA